MGTEPALMRAFMWGSGRLTGSKGHRRPRKSRAPDGRSAAGKVAGAGAPRRFYMRFQFWLRQSTPMTQPCIFRLLPDRVARPE